MSLVNLEETGIKEYNALINLCIEKAREGNDEDISLDHMHKAFQLFSSLREQGFPSEEETYGPFLVYLIDMGMIPEFHFFSKFVKDENPTSFSRLAYYEMLLWIAVKDEEKVQELCNSVGLDSSSHSLALAENYLLALCKNDMQKEILQLLELVDVTEVSSLKFLTDIFSSLGRLALESYVEKFILAFRLAGTQEEKISSLIYNYDISIPNLEVEEVVSKFKSLHKKLEGRPSSASNDNLITYCCDLQKAVINTEGNSGWEELVESRLEDEYDNQELNGMAALAYRCIDSSPINRPSMKDIVQELSQIRSYRNNRAMLEEVPISKYTQDIQNPVAEYGGEEADDTTQVLLRCFSV